MRLGTRRTIISSGDPDAMAYILRAGVTNATGKAALIAWVKGIKSLGLWNSIVCWPLISTQNKGSGSTIYSLGGLGTYNATIVNGATWGSSGIVFTATTQKLTATFSISGTQGGMGMVKASPSTTADGIAFQQNNYPNSYRLEVYIDGKIYFDYPEGSNRLNVDGGLTANQMAMMLGFASASGSAIYKNASLLGSNAIAGGAGATLGTRSIFELGTNNTQTVPFLILSTLDFRTSAASFYSLYKSTLGTSLGLP